jgi:hypothetical protein
MQNIFSKNFLRILGINLETLAGVRENNFKIMLDNIISSCYNVFISNTQTN